MGWVGGWVFVCVGGFGCVGVGVCVWLYFASDIMYCCLPHKHLKHITN